MSEKFNGFIWRKIKDGIGDFLFYLPITILAIVFFAILLIIGVAIKGLVLSVCWNIAMPAMFGFNEITLFQAIILVCGVSFE